MANDWKSKMARFFEKGDKEIKIFEHSGDYLDFLEEFTKDPKKFEHLEFLEEVVEDQDRKKIVSEIIKQKDVVKIWKKLFNVLQLEGLKAQIRPLFKGNKSIFLGADIAGVKPNDARLAQPEDDGGPLDRNVYKQMVDNLKKNKTKWTNFLRALGVRNGPEGTSEEGNFAFTPFEVGLQSFRDTLDALFDEFRDDGEKHYGLPQARENFDRWREELESSANTFFEKLEDLERNWGESKAKIPFDEDIKNFKSLFDAVLFNSPAAEKYFEGLAARYGAEGKEVEKYNFYNTDERQNSAVALASFLSKKDMSEKRKPEGKPSESEEEKS